MFGTEIYLIAIVFLASQAAAYVVAEDESFIFEAEDACPAADPCPPKLISYEDDCNHYYECKNQEKILKTCKTGLRFSKKWQGCVKPENSECSNDPVIPDNNSTDVKCVTNGDLLPHECQCTKFYECKNKKKILQDCPLGQFFDKDRKTCIPGRNCKAIGSECKDGDFINHECQCHKYYLCKNGQKVLRECEAGSHFDSDLSKCVTGKCGDDNNKTCTSGEKKTHECKCEIYYVCKNNDWIAEECLKGQHFSPTKLKCMNEEIAGCKDNPTNPPIGTCPDNVPSLWRHECDCRLYYECIEDKKQLQACPWGRYFDYVNQVCEIAEKVFPKCRNNWDDWNK